MNTAEMITAFKIGYDIANLEGPGYEDEEILRFLNQAQTIEIMKEVALRRWTYISNIVENTVFDTQSLAVTYPYNYHLYLPLVSEYLAYVSSASKITRHTFKATSGEEWVNNIFIRKEQAMRYVSSSLNHVILIVPRVYEEEDRSLSILYDRHTTFSGNNDFALSYVKVPIPITLIDNSDVNEILHERIVNTAVDLGKKVWNPQEAGVSQQTDQLMDKPEV